MINNYVNCEDCEYQDFCENFDPFYHCPDGKSVERNTTIEITLLTSKNEAKLNDN